MKRRTYCFEGRLRVHKSERLFEKLLFLYQQGHISAQGLFQMFAPSRVPEWARMTYREEGTFHRLDPLERFYDKLGDLDYVRALTQEQLLHMSEKKEE